MEGRRRSSTLPLSVSLVFVVVVSATLFSAIIEGAGAGRPQRSPSQQALAICQRTDYPSLCVAYAVPARRRGHRVTVASMTKRSIITTITKTKQADATARKLAATASRGKDGMKKANLNVCDQVYRDALTNLQMSVKNLKAKAMADLKINLSAALSDYTACNDGFTETPGGVSPLAKVNTLLNQLVSNSLALAEMNK